MIKNQNCAVESYMAPSCQVVEVKSQQVLCQSTGSIIDDWREDDSDSDILGC